ncbi:nuclear transport factor 2 family protein [Nocardia cyriacigeorgica]|uniref:Nuclear transport factor 2 family protein n=1 Tax=Nocardia cyriacigeorgica TaxID=135487 RepID=A0A6P1D3L6_9NOCA|nr:nuclear transport factor 2 family protein [Nocardia cyriacigeorgica]NEW37612.1 nuclear transport factor 2 family protein [Nocardia cyriacigeorgica]NEW45057.1 nuclear transport factor 2 family protein [Nocardia cyriacigeorgica]NEW49000.1 nuclear transport factor 2 family protein [Nocardia cyriacigeorgica]NEW55101.1 nuclear transport factor 2 family protein [Nocardia cyriacigeorgica]
MVDLQAIADRVEIEALRAEFSDAAMMSDTERLASLYTEDGVYRIPAVNIEQSGREEIRRGTELHAGQWEYFVQTTHAGSVVLDGDTATGRAYICELGRLNDGRSIFNYALFHDRYRRTADGWKFAERTYEVRYFDTTPLPGSPDVVWAAEDARGRATALDTP